ncbi:MAG TPA: hypothetical protein VJX67_02280 [Blastocatellia bacterium]|nr:hypothetical protein [Blastocatellia bacterium]
MNDGGVQVEWRGPGGTLELEVHPGRKLDYLLITGQDENRIYEENEDISKDRLMNLLTRIFLSPQEN